MPRPLGGKMELRPRLPGSGSAWHGRAMPLIRPSRPNTYSGSPLDRAAKRREDEAWIAAALAAEETLWAPVWRGRNLMRGVEDGAPEAVFLTGAAAAALRLAGGPWAFLGLYEGVPLFAVDASAAEDPLPLLPEALGSFTDLRAVAGLLPPEQASILAHARALMHWRTRHRFCGVCGAPCEPRSAGHVMLCSNLACATQHFPRTDPAVIMLVTHGGRALLGHSARFPSATMYSTLAGFVEPGESLEEAVAREVFEEAGVRVTRISYHSSQPWPFPASIMLGFYAEALDSTIVLDREELEDARWFSRAEIRDCAAHGFSIPRIDSIARRLIEDWVAAGE
jgi:NAD+ diphosphatase